MHFDSPLPQTLMEVRIDGEWHPAEIHNWSQGPEGRRADVAWHRRHSTLAELGSFHEGNIREAGATF